MKSLSSVIECAETELSKTENIDFSPLILFSERKVFLCVIGYVMVQQMQFLGQFSSVSTSTITGNHGVQQNSISCERRG